MLLTRNAITRPVTSPIAPPTSSPGASRSIARSTECNSVSKSSCAAGTTRTPTIAPTTGAATRNVSCQNWLATWSEIRWRSACCPSRKPVVPKIAAKTSRRTAVPIPRPGSVGEKRATDVVRYESAALREAQARASGGEDARRDQIVDHLPIPRFRERYGIDVEARYRKVVDDLVAAGVLAAGGARLRLTQRGRFVANDVCGAFLAD